MDSKLEACGGTTTSDIRHVCRCVAEQSPLPMAAVAGPGHIVQYANPPFCLLLEKKCDDLVGFPFVEVVPEASEYRDALDRVAGTGKAETGTEARPSTQHAGNWSYGLWPILNADQLPIGVMLQLTDTTEFAHFRERVVAMNQKLILSEVAQQELAEKYHLAKKSAELANEAKDQFLAVLSHELRTPLTPVLAAVTMLQRDTRFDLATQNLLQMIRRNVEMEARLIDDLLDLTRIVQGKVVLDMRPVELIEIIGYAVEVCSANIHERQIEFELDAPDGPYPVLADGARLRQVFWNLLKNAVKFTPPRGRVGIRCRREGDGRVAVQVNDSGHGISPETLERLFHPFEQGGEQMTRRFGGLGLGLVISKSLVEQHGGTIEAISGGEGKGATFTIRLPLLLDAVTTVPDAKANASPTPKAPFRSLRILYVEDHNDTAALMRELLEMEGHRVRTASDMTTALDAAALEEFDVLISDLGLPDGSGFDLMRALRTRGQQLPGIALSGYGLDHSIRESHESGFAMHLVKPVSVDHLLDALTHMT